MKVWMPWMLPALAGLALGDACPGSAGGPVVEGPGAVSCGSSPIAGGVRTTYTIAGDTVLRWTDFRLVAGDELIFDFVDPGDSVANLLDGAFHRIDGRVESNGAVGFFTAGILSVDGRVEAREVTLSALELADPPAFLTDGDLVLEGGNFLSIGGEVEATGGDVRLAGSLVRVGGEARVRASEAVRMGAGDRVEIAATGPRRVSATGATGVLLHLGDTGAAELELVAGGEVNNAGRLEAGGGAGQVFLEVGAGGVIRNEGTGVILGQPVIVGNFDNQGVLIGLDEGDTLPLVNSSVVKIPTVKRADGTVATKARKIETNAAMTGSADALRKPVARGGERVAKRALMKRQSFFGMRGGRAAKNENGGR